MLGIYVRTSKENTEVSIEQQKQAGIAFASQNHMEFEVYEDEGKSGYKLADDEVNIFLHRQAFSRLLDDAKSKKIDSVWVWEHSRLSRNQYASSKIFYDFEKQGVKVYVKDSLYDFKDKNAKFMRQIFDGMAEYERELIVARTTRGTHDMINRGERSHGKLYGYKKIGVNEKGYQILENVESEIENIKYGYKRILEGATLRQLTLELYKGKKLKNKMEGLRMSQKWHKILTHFVYTGFALNMEGLQIFKDFRTFKIDNLSALHDERYYTKSKIYTVKIISIDKWIKVAERLQINSKIRLDYKINKASKDLATGLLTCSECGQKYYSYTHSTKRNNATYEYSYYKHYSPMSREITDCGQKKSFAVGSINEIFTIFFFLNYAVYDNTKETFEETLRALKQGQLESGERIKSIEKEIKQSDRNIKKFEEAIDKTEDISTVTVLAKRISVEEEKRQKLNIELSNMKVELEKLKIAHSRTEIESMYYNVKDKINEFFKTKSMETKRDLLVQAIKKCVVMGTCILIDTGFSLYIFDTKIKFNFKKEMFESLGEDKIYKEHYLEKMGEGKLSQMVLDTSIMYMEDNLKKKIFEEGDMQIWECKLSNNRKIEKTFNERVAKEIFERYKIEYDISCHTLILFFLDRLF